MRTSSSVSRQLCRQYGKPTQHPTARLEPDEVLALDIVSASRRNEWRTHVRLGREVRLGRTPRREGELQSRPAVGVDLGTCNSLVGLLAPSGDVEILPVGGGRSVVPSVVNFDRNLDYVVGWAALDADRTRPEGSVFYPKRDLGTPTQYAIHDRSLTPEFVCSLLLRSMRQSAEERLGQPITAVVASYPAAYGIAQVNALRAAYDLAEWHVDRFVVRASDQLVTYRFRPPSALISTTRNASLSSTSAGAPWTSRCSRSAGILTIPSGRCRCTQRSVTVDLAGWTTTRPSRPTRASG